MPSGATVWVVSLAQAAVVSGGGVYYLDAPTGGLERADPVAYTAKPLAGGR